jgi:hypothetical protein
MPHVVLIETQGNQRYIFATNRLRENAGASELTARVGPLWTIEAVVNAGGTHVAPLLDLFGEAYCCELVKLGEAQPVEANGLEIVFATSGLALLLVNDIAKGREIVSRVTERALIEAPGLVVRGFIGESFVLANTTDAAKAVRDCFRGIERLRAALPPPEARFPMLTLLLPCQSSGLPAVTEMDGRTLAWPAAVKAEERDPAALRIIKSLGEAGRKLERKVDALETLPWLAIIHADGNGFGQLFLRFKDYCGEESARGYFNKLRRFSAAIERAGLSAFAEAICDFPAVEEERDGKKTELQKMVPLVLGGDDLTVVCDGRHALPFTDRYLKAFEHKAKDDTDIAAVAGLAGTRIGAAAGVAIIKPHFPFYRGYELSAALLQSAKKEWKATGSSVDFQVVYEDAAFDLDVLRKRWKVDDRNLTARPFLVTNTVDCPSHRTFAGLEAAAGELLSKDPDRRSKLPRSQQHVLRDALFESEATVVARFKLVEKRYDLKWEKLANGGSLFFGDRRAILLDAMNVNDLGAETAA